MQLCPRVAMRCAASVALYPGQRHAGSHHSAFGSFAQLPSHHSAVAVSTTLLHVVFASPAPGVARMWLPEAFVQALLELCGLLATTSSYKHVG